MEEGLTYRTVSELVISLIHTILCERGVSPELFNSYETRQGIVFSVSWYPAISEYLNKVYCQLKSYICVQKCTRVYLSIYEAPFTGQVSEQWQFDVKFDGESQAAAVIAPSQLVDAVQALVKQVNASASYMPPLSPENLFKVSFLARNDLSISSKCSMGQILNFTHETLHFRNFEAGYRVSTLVNLSSPK